MIQINKTFEALIPPLSDDEFKQLEANILKEGIRDPLVVWGETLVDGHNRYRIAQKHGISYEVVKMDFADESEVMEWMDRNQIGRRNLSPDMMSYIRGRMYNRMKEAHGGARESSGQNVHLPKTSEILAQQTGVSEKTVRRDEQYFKAVEKVAAALDQPGAHLITKDIATKKEMTILANVAETNPESARQIVEKAKDLTGNSNGRKITDQSRPSIKTAFRELKKEQEAEKASTIVISSDKVDFRLGDFIDELSHIPDNSIDLIVTDPPYPFEFIEQWSKLSAFSKRVLKPGGFCITYSGQMHLPEVMRRMTEHLDYYWTFCLLHGGFAQFLTPRNLYVNWKPILIFQNGFSLYKPDKQQPFDVIDGAGKQKGSHVWQQNESELDMLIDYFSTPGEKILDPFAGSGSTLVKAIEMKRIAIGCEIDEQHYNNAKKRIQDALS